MKALLRSLIIFLYPAQCRHCGEKLDPADGHYICKECWKEVGIIKSPYCDKCGSPLNPNAVLPERVPSCPECPKKTEFRKARSVAYYYDIGGNESAAAKAIHLLKYQGKSVMAKPLADLMINNMPDFFNVTDYNCIIPVPIHRKKRWKRGYNQTELIVRQLGKAMGIPMDARSLIKIKDTPPQVGLTLNKRLENVSGSFGVKDSSKTAGKRILLVDDVMTTGATANECAKTLVKQGKAEFVDVFTVTRVSVTHEGIIQI